MLLPDWPTMPKCKRCGGSGHEPDLAKAGRAIRKARLRKGLALRKVARQAKCSATYLCDIEHGRRAAFSGAKARRLMAVLGVTL